jgi:hypothetical protein
VGETIEVVAQQRDVGGFEREVGSGCAHRDAGVGCRRFAAPTVAG